MEKTRVEILLDALNNNETIDNWVCRSRLEEHLIACINKTGIEGLSTPRCRLEELLQVLAVTLKEGGTGDSTDNSTDNSTVGMSESLTAFSEFFFNMWVNEYGGDARMKGKNSITLPEEIYEMGDLAFTVHNVYYLTIPHDCKLRSQCLTAFSNLKTLTLKNLNRNVGSLFNSSSNTSTALYSPSSLTKIEITGCSGEFSGDFGYTTSLTEIILNEGITSFGPYVYTFRGCSGLTKIELPSTFEGTFNGGTFSGCTNLNTLVIKNNNVVLKAFTSQYNDMFSETPLFKNGTGIVYVPDNLVEAYKADSTWTRCLSDANTQIKPLSEYTE